MWKGKQFSMDEKAANSSSVTDAEKKERKEKIKSIAKDAVIFLVIFTCILLVLRFIKFPQISGSSMNPGLTDGQYVVAITTHDVDVGDIVVVWCPQMNDYLVKRVIGVAGDTITISKGRLYRNGVEMYEPYLQEQDWNRDPHEHTETIPDGKIYVLGDNRNESTDSRTIGLLSVSDVQMKVIATPEWINKFK